MSKNINLRYLFAYTLKEWIASINGINIGFVGVDGKETNDELNHSPGFEPGYIYTLLHTKGGLRVSLTKSYFMTCTKTTRHTSAAFYVTFTIITVLLD